MDAKTQKAVDKFNKLADSISHQELAIDKVKDKIQELQTFKEFGLLKDSESQQLIFYNRQLGIMESRLNQTKQNANGAYKVASKLLNQKSNKLGMNLNDVNKTVKEVKNGIGKLTKRITGLFASAFIFNVLSDGFRKLSSQMTSLLKTDETFNASLQQIKANLMTAFAPIYNACLPAINSLMNGLARITGTIAKFVSQVFHINLGDAMNQAKKLSGALKETSKSGKEAGNGLSSIDNLDVLSDSSNSSDLDIKNGNEINYSDEIQYSQTLLNLLNRIKDFVVQNKELLCGFLIGIASGILAIKLGLGGIKSLGIGLAIAGIVIAISSIIEYINDSSWENFGKIITGVGLVVAGVALIFGAWPLAVAGAIAALIGLVVSNWEKIKEFLLGIVDWIFSHIEEIGDKFGWFGQIISVLFASWLSGFTTFLDQIFGGAKDILDGIMKIFRGDFKGGIEQIFTGLIKIVTAPFAALYEAGKVAWEGIKKIFSSLAEFFGNIFSSAWRKVKDVFSVGGKVFDGIKEGIVESFKKIVNAIISGINKVVSIPFNGINKALSKFKNLEIAGMKPFSGIISTINVPRIPELATGAVIPPRQKFMAILGDQKHGTNIEAPLDTIKQANREVLTEFFDKLGNLTAQTQEIILKNLSIVIQLGAKDFKRVVYEAIRMTEKELGKSLFVS